MISPSENLDAVIKNYRWSTSVTHEDFKLMMLGAAVIDNIFGDNTEHSVRVERGFSELEATLEVERSTQLHRWGRVEDEESLVCQVCGVLETDCGASSYSWLCRPTLDAA